jgi:hypothetical protein
VGGSLADEVFFGSISATPVVFTTSDAERMRIDTSGNLLVSTTSSNFAAAGSQLGVGGNNYMTRSGANPLLLNRLSSDGDILSLAKDGTVVGTIGTGYGQLYIGTGDTALYFDSTDETIVPYNASTNSQRANAINLGRSAAPFKDLYLSGGAYLGGTGSANHLDDYEEGTYTPTWSSIAGNPSSYYNADNTNTGLSYVKIGRQVTISGSAIFNSGSSINNTRPFMSLPFAARIYSVTGVISSFQTNSQSAVNYLNYSSTTAINLFKLNSTGSHVPFGANAAIELYINITYQTYA